MRPSTASWPTGDRAHPPLGSPAGAPPTPGDPTWFYRKFSSDSWTRPGGDFVSDPSAAASFGSPGSSYHFDSTPVMIADLQGWLDNPASNFGWIIRGDEAGFSTAV